MNECETCGVRCEDGTDICDKCFILEMFEVTS